MRHTVRVEIAPLGGMIDVVAGNDLDWLDITRYWVRGTDPVTASRGRSGDGSGTLSAGSCTFTLDNPGGVWTPGRPALLLEALEQACGGRELFAARFPTLAERTYSEVAAAYGTYGEWATSESYYSDDPGGMSLLDMPVRLSAVAERGDPGYSTGETRYSDLAADCATYTDVALAHESYGEIGPISTALWTGAITCLSQSWDNGMRSRIQVTAADPAAWATSTKLRTLATQSTIAAGDLAWCFPLGETEEPLADIVGSNRVGRWARPLTRYNVGADPDGTLELGAVPGPGAGDVKAPQWVGGGRDNGWLLSTGRWASGAMSTAGPYAHGAMASSVTGSTIHAMFRPAGFGDQRGILGVVGAGGAIMHIRLTAAGHVEVQAAADYYRALTLTCPDPVTSGQWHHVAVTLEQSSGSTTPVKVYVDGTVAAAGTCVDRLYDLGTAAIIVGSDVWLRDPMQGSIHNVSGHTAVLSATLIARIAGCRDGWTGDDTGHRASRLAWAAGANLDWIPGMSTMSAQPTEGVTVADAMTTVADAESGMWWVAGDGTLRQQNRAVHWDMLLPTATIPTTSLDSGWRWEADHDGRVTVATYTRPGSAPYTARHPDWARIGTYLDERTLYLDSDAQLQAFAEAAVTDQAANPSPRSPTLAVDVLTCDATVDAANLLSVDIGDVIAVTDPLPEAPPGPLLQVVGVAHRITVSGWMVTWNVTAVDTAAGPVFALDTSALDGADVLVL